MRVGAVDGSIYSVYGEQLEYALALDQDSMLAISACSGELRVARGVEIDYEARMFDAFKGFTFAVNITDATSGRKLGECSVTVNITDVDEPPEFLSSGESFQACVRYDPLGIRRVGGDSIWHDSAGSSSFRHVIARNAA